jgi:transposase
MAGVAERGLRATGVSSGDEEVVASNRRLAEVALWVDGSARWVDRATEAAQAAAPRRRQVTVTFDQAELETFVTGFRGMARVLIGLAQPVPPPISTASQGCHLRLVTDKASGRA